MPRTKTSGLISAVILLLAVSAIRAEAATQRLKLDGTTLKPVGAPPLLALHDRLVVVIEDQPDTTPPWQFTLNKRKLTAVDGASLQYKIEVGDWARSLKSVALELEDSTGAFSMAPLTIPLKSNPNTGTDKGLGASSIRRPTYDRDKNEVNLYFDEHGLPARPLPIDMDDNDVLLIHLVGASDVLAKMSIVVVGNLAGDEFAIRGIEAIPEGAAIVTRGGEEGVEIVQYMGTFGPFSPPSLEIQIRESADDGSTETKRSHTIRIGHNYLAGLSLGVAWSDLRLNQYSVVTSSTGTSEIRNTSDDDGEPRLFLEIVFYAWRFWEPRFWNGCDLDEQPTLASRVNPFVGIGLDEFGDEYYAGFSFELARGLDISYSLYVAKTKVLDGGFEEGDAFAGSSNDIPVREEWDTAGAWGLAVDLRVATKIIGGLFNKAE